MITNLSIGRYGRFGNMLFQIAAVVGIARRSGQSYGFERIMNYDHLERFGSKEDIDLEPYFVNPFPRLDKDRGQFQGRHFGFGFYDIYLPGGDWDLAGHFQSERYFTHCIQEVRDLLTMRDEPDLQDVVAVHLRRGDYDDAYHPILRQEYYKPAIDTFWETGTQYLVFSDDPLQAEQLIHTTMGYPRGRFLYSEYGYLSDFRMMKRCRHFIIANSSFSLMAAILSPAPDKKIIAPRRWFGPAWGVQMATRDIYPQNSTII